MQFSFEERTACQFIQRSFCIINNKAIKTTSALTKPPVLLPVEGDMEGELEDGREAQSDTSYADSEASFA